MNVLFLPCCCLLFILSSCNQVNTDHNSTAVNDTNKVALSSPIPAPTVLSSFVFMGCNRVDRHDKNKPAATNASTANLSALKRIYKDITQLPQQPDLFFFLGDMVLGETNLNNMDAQLAAWVQLYKDSSFSSISSSNIELIAVPGNHEMLSYHNNGEWPLKGATAIWMKHMSPYIPTDAAHVTGADSLKNRATFAFKRGNVGFIVMNTDTYDAPTASHPFGLEGQIPVHWIGQKIKEFRADPAIEHTFVLGHKPYYVMGTPRTDHAGLADGAALWPLLENNRVVALLSSHVHTYYREQPQDTGTYQIIAGNGGSPPIDTAVFFGYTIINIMSDGTIELDARGFDMGTPYYRDVPKNPMTSRDKTTLTWEPNPNPYKK